MKCRFFRCERGLPLRHIQLRINALFGGIRAALPRVWMGLFFVLVLPAVGFAQSSPTTQLIFGQPNSFGIGPRAMGMGGAFTAVADDASAAYWNAAGLAQLSSYEISLSSAPVYFDNNVAPGSNPPWQGFDFPWYESMQFMFPIAKENTLGISFFRPFHPQMDYFPNMPNLSTLDREEGSYILNPTFQESIIQLSYAARLSAVRNFSVGISVKRVTNDPYYLLPITTNLESQLPNTPRVIGYGLDLGLLYKIPITKYSEEFRVALAINNLVTNVTYPNGLQVGDNNIPLNFSPGPGTSIQVPPQITLGLAYKNDFLFKIRNITAFDFDQISDPDFTDAYNKYLRFGTEFWFLKDVLGVRAGYSTPLSSPGDISIGGSIRALGGDFEIDASYLFPVAPQASVSQGSAIGTYSTGGYDFEPFNLGIAYRFGGGQEIPPPKVSAFVRPASFTPSQGEKTIFFLDTTEDIPVNRWSVLIYDNSNHLVRGLRGSGSPPTKLVWQGENDQYEPLPPGVYTWSFQVLDNLDHIGSTPVQTIEILGAPEAGVKDPSKLLALRQQQAGLLAQERQQLSSLAQENLQRLLGTEPTPTAVITPPVEAAGNTTIPEAGGVPAIGFTNLTPDQVLSAHFDKNPAGDTIVAVSYRSNLTYGPYLYEEAADVIKASVKTVGTSLKAITTRVYYGKNELTLITPTEVAANYATGKISESQLVQLSDVHINGVKVGPNVQ
jgi:hypothetical protein